MPNRRDFIKSVVGASAGVVFTGCAICDAMAAGRPAQVGSGKKHKPVMVGNRRVKTVDVHCHVSVPEATDLLKGTKIERRLGAGIARKGWLEQTDVVKSWGRCARRIRTASWHSLRWRCSFPSWPPVSSRSA